MMENKKTKVLNICEFYVRYLEDFYARNQNLINASSEEQASMLLKDGFSAIHLFTPYLDKEKVDSKFLVYNSLPLSMAWCREEGLEFPALSSIGWEKAIVKMMIEHIKPDVLHIGNTIDFDGRFLRLLDYRPKVIVGWRGADIPIGTDWTGYDILMSGLPKLLDFAETVGATQGVIFPSGIPEWIVDQIKDIPKTVDVVFAGGINPFQHQKRLEFLTSLAEAANTYGFSLELYLSCDPRLKTLPKVLEPFLRPAVFGLDMHKTLAKGKIIVDSRGGIGLVDKQGVRQIDLAGEDTINMRMFETTAGGSLLITNSLKNIIRFFEPEREIVTYDTTEDAIKKILYYLKNPKKLERIANAGRSRCLREYNMTNRAHSYYEMIKEVLDKKNNI